MILSENQRRIVARIHIREAAGNRVIFRIKESGVPIRCGAFVEQLADVRHQQCEIAFTADGLAAQ